MVYVPRSMLSQLAQAGAETTPGVGGSANKRFPTVNWGLEPAGNAFDEVRHAGGKYVGSILPADSWSEGPLGSSAAGGGGGGNLGIDFNELAYLADSNINHATPSAVDIGYKRNFVVNPDGPDTVSTYVVERGVSGALRTMRNVLVPDLGLTFRRVGASNTAGRVVGKKAALSTGAPTTATSVAQQVLSSTKNGLWSGTSYANLVASAARLDPLGYMLEWHNNGRFAPYFAMDDLIIGPAGFLEGAVDCGGTMTIGFDVTGTDYSGIATIAKLEAGSLLFIRAQNTGPALGATNYKLTLDLCMQLSAPPRGRAEGNVLVYDWPFKCVPDAVDNAPFKLEIINAVASI